MLRTTSKPWPLYFSTALVFAACTGCALFWVLGSSPGLSEIAQHATQDLGKGGSVESTPNGGMRKEDGARILGGSASAVAPSANSASASTANETSVVGARLKLLGVAAGSQSQGHALIAVDAQPAKTFWIGREVIDGWLLQSVQARAASLSKGNNAPVLTLALPPAGQP